MEKREEPGNLIRAHLNYRLTTVFSSPYGRFYFLTSKRLNSFFPSRFSRLAPHSVTSVLVQRRGMQRAMLSKPSISVGQLKVFLMIINAGISVGNVL